MASCLLGSVLKNSVLFHNFVTFTDAGFKQTQSIGDFIVSLCKNSFYMSFIFFGRVGCGRQRGVSVLQQSSTNQSGIKQQGVALIATLMVLVIIAVLGATVIHRTLSAKKNSNSLRDMEAACLAAEAALQYGSEKAAGDPYTLNPLVLRGSYPLAADSEDDWYKTDSNWLASDVKTVTDFKKISGSTDTFLFADPLYRLEVLKEDDTTDPSFTLFLVTAKGFGRSSKATCFRQVVVYEEGDEAN